MDTSVVARRTRRRRQAIIGVAGLAVLGAGSFLVTSQVVDDARTETKDAAALVPIAPVDETPAESAAPAAAPSASAVPPSASAVPTSASAVPTSASAEPPAATPSSTRSYSKAVEKRIKAARAAAARDGHPVQRALTPSKPAAHAGPVTVKTTGSLAKDGATMRVLSAKYDLSGQREMLWAADDGVPVGDARCTQNFHFSNNKVAHERPTMLLCWRTSATKSVVTVAVVKTGRPAKPASVAVIDKLWRKP